MLVSTYVCHALSSPQINNRPYHCNCEETKGKKKNQQVGGEESKNKEIVLEALHITNKNPTLYKNQFQNQCKCT